MRLLYVTSGISPYVVGGMQTVARRHILGLCQRGFDLSYVHTFRREQRVESDLPGDEFVLDFPFRRGFFRISPWHYPAELKSYSVEVDKIVQRVEPDCIYCDGPLIFRTLKSIDCCPVIFHPHGLDMYQDQMSIIRNLRSRTLRPLFKYHAKRADKVISQGGHLTEILENQIGVLPSRIVFLPNSVPAFHGIVSKKNKSSPLKCLFVGRNDPKKGFDLLLAAITNNVAANLEVVGIDGENSDRISWHGLIKNSKFIERLYQMADVLVLPSYSEGMATVLLEAMKFGMPVIATDVGAAREVVINDQTGWLIRPGRVDDLVSAIEKVNRLDNVEFAKFSANCIEHVTSNFLDETVADRLAAIIQGTCNGTP